MVHICADTSKSNKSLKETSYREIIKPRVAKKAMVAHDVAAALAQDVKPIDPRLTPKSMPHPSSFATPSPKASTSATGPNRLEHGLAWRLWQ